MGLNSVDVAERQLTDADAADLLPNPKLYESLCLEAERRSLEVC